MPDRLNFMKVIRGQQWDLKDLREIRFRSNAKRLIPEPFLEDFLSKKGISLMPTLLRIRDSSDLLRPLKKNNKRYAIKYLNKNWAPIEAEKIKNQCLKEYEQLCKLDGLNNCCVASTPKAYAFGEVCTNRDANRYPAIVMDYVEEPSLFEAIEHGLISGDPTERIDTKTSIQIAINIAEGYYALHKAGVIHRDGSQNNIRIGIKDGYRITFLDFGNSINLGTARETFTRGATPYFGAPEVFDKNANRNHPGQDLWTLGALIYYIRYGEKPHKKLIEESNGTPSDYLEIKKKYPLDLVKALGPNSLQKGDKELAAFILSCTQYNIQDRIDSFKNNSNSFSFDLVVDQLKNIQKRISINEYSYFKTQQKFEPYTPPLSHRLKNWASNDSLKLRVFLKDCLALAKKLNLQVDTVDISNHPLSLDTLQNDNHFETNLPTDNPILIRIKESQNSHFCLDIRNIKFNGNSSKYLLAAALNEHLKEDYYDLLSLVIMTDCISFDNEKTLKEIKLQIAEAENDLDTLNLELTNHSFMPTMDPKGFKLSLEETTKYKNSFVPRRYILKINKNWNIEHRVEVYKDRLRISQVAAKAISFCNNIEFLSFDSFRNFKNTMETNLHRAYFKEILPKKRLILFDTGNNPKEVFEILRKNTSIFSGRTNSADATIVKDVKLPCIIWWHDENEYSLAYELKFLGCKIVFTEDSDVFYAKGIDSLQLDSLSTEKRFALLSETADKSEDSYSITDYQLITSLLSKTSQVKLKELIENIPIPDAYSQIISSPHPWENSTYEAIRFKKQLEEDTIHSSETEKLSNGDLHLNQNAQQNAQLNYQKDELESILEKDYSDFTESDWQFILNQMNENTIEKIKQLSDNRGWKIFSSCSFVLERTPHPWKDSQRFYPKYKSVEQLPL